MGTKTGNNTTLFIFCQELNMIPIRHTVYEFMTLLIEKEQIQPNLKIQKSAFCIF
jgi:hypothetical protein